MTIRNLKQWIAAATLAGLTGTAYGQTLVAVDDEALIPEISRDAADIRDVLRPRPDLDSVDTALIFTNPRNQATVVVCAGTNANGRGVGRAKTLVPANGVRIIFASDLSSGHDYIGSATCKSRSRVVPTAFVVGADLSDTRAIVSHGWRDSQINFPLVAAF